MCLSFTLSETSRAERAQLVRLVLLPADVATTSTSTCVAPRSRHQPAASRRQPRRSAPSPRAAAPDRPRSAAPPSLPLPPPAAPPPRPPRPPPRPTRPPMPSLPARARPYRAAASSARTSRSSPRARAASANLARRPRLLDARLNATRDLSTLLHYPLDFGWVAGRGSWVERSRFSGPEGFHTTCRKYIRRYSLSAG